MGERKRHIVTLSIYKLFIKLPYIISYTQKTTTIECKNCNWLNNYIKLVGYNQFQNREYICA